MHVTTCFITKDHDRSLAAAINSVRGLSDRIIVVDAGSKDATCEIAKSAGANVLPFEWSDDFAAACNFALEACTSEWVLWLNPDETLSSEAQTAIPSAVRQASAFAYQFPIRQLYHPDSPDTVTWAKQVRLFPNQPEVRYEGRVHPYFRTPLATLAWERGLEVRTIEAQIVRKAFLSVNTPDKMRWVVRLLEAEVRDRPERLACQIELGRNLLWLNDPRGHAILAKAAETVAAVAHQPFTPDSMVGMLFEYILNADPSQVATALSVTRVQELIPIWFPTNPPVLWAGAQERFRAKDYRIAANLLEKLLNLGHSGWYDCPEGFNPEIIGPTALMNLGLCHSQLRDWLQARTCFEHLLNHPHLGAQARQFFAESDREWRATLGGSKPS